MGYSAPWTLVNYYIFILIITFIVQSIVYISINIETWSGQTKDYNKNVDIKFSAHDTFLV
jgi:hypothetical protein